MNSALLEEPILATRSHPIESTFRPAHPLPEPSDRYPISLSLLKSAMVVGSAAPFPVASGMRLLEISCGLSPAEVENLLTTPTEMAAPSAPVADSALTLYQRFSIIAWSLLLTALVVAGFAFLS